MRTARSLTVSLYLVISHACPPPPRATMHAPLEQPRMPPSNHACPPEQPCMPPGSNHTHPPEQPCMPPPRSNHTWDPTPRSNHAHPLGATTHALQEQPCMPPTPRINHACPPEQPCMPPGATMHTPSPRSNHACPPEQPRMPPLWTECGHTLLKILPCPNFVAGGNYHEVISLW